MNALELRLGNYVTIENPKYWPEVKGCPMIVTGFKFKTDRLFPESSGSVDLQYGDTLFSQFDEFIQPIPLTDKWLLNFGLDKDWMPEFKYGVRVTLSQNDRAYSFKRSDIKIDYVHQLQNLWFTLTGEELKFV